MQIVHRSNPRPQQAGWLLRGAVATALALTLSGGTGLGIALAQENPAAPNTTITDGPPAQFSYDAEFEFTGSDDVTAPEALAFECAVVNFTDWTSCTSPYTVGGLPFGDHTFAVRAIDGDGNVDQSPATWSWTIVPTCNFSQATIWIDYNGIVRGGPNNGTPAGLSGNLVVLNGTGNADVIYGTNLNPVEPNPFGAIGDLIDARGGNDVVCAAGGWDTVKGGGGADTIYGGFGNDTLEGEGGNDALYGAEGNDTLRGGGDNDQLFAFTGLDTMDGGNGNDTLSGGPNVNGPEADTFRCDAGTDTANNVDQPLDTVRNCETVKLNRTAP